MEIYKNFISFEGIDYSGKTTQIKLLMKRLSEKDIPVTLVREPGGTVISEKIREILLSNDHSEMNEKTELLLYEAARAQLVHQKILPLLNKGRHVIADRFFDSTTAYQGYGRRLNLQVVQIINHFATSDLKPYKTFFIDISPDEAERRQILEVRHQDRLEKSGKEFFTLIRNGFLEMCRQDPERFIQIDGSRNSEVIAEDIWQVISEIWVLAS